MVYIYIYIYIYIKIIIYLYYFLSMTMTALRSEPLSTHMWNELASQIRRSLIEYVNASLLWLALKRQAAFNLCS